MTAQQAQTVHRLEGLEPNNLLAFLALLGLLRALEAADARESDSRMRVKARVSWSINAFPLRPRLHLARSMTQQDVAVHAATGVGILATVYKFDGLAKLKLTPEQARQKLIETARAMDELRMPRAELLAALISDMAVREKGKTVERTPFCLLDVAQTSFLKNLAAVLSSINGQQEAIEKATFHPWTWVDETPSFRWDPIEDTRHAYRWAAPTDDKQTVEHGANVLAAVGLPVLTVVPQQHGSSVRLRVIGGANKGGEFFFAWPIWREPASLAAIRALLTHVDLWKNKALDYLGVDHVMVTRRIVPSRYMNFTPAKPL
jgi:hypothetical protein